MNNSSHHRPWLARSCLLTTLLLILAACGAAETPAAQAPSAPAPASVAASTAPAPSAPAAASAAGTAATLLSWRLGTGTEDFERATFEQFNTAQTDVAVDYDPALTGLAWGTEGMQKLRTAMVNEAGPDFLGDIDIGENLKALVATGQVMDLTQAYPEHGWNKMPQHWIDWATVDGKIYAIPQEVHHGGVFYNKQIFEELGLAVPTTWDEFVAVLEKTKAAGYVPYALGLGGGWPSDYQAVNYMYSAAGDELIEAFTAKKPWTECSGCLEGLTQYRRLMTDYSNPDITGLTMDQANDQWFQGKAAMTFMHSPWNGPALAPPDFPFGFFVVPRIDPQSKWSGVGGIGGSFIVASYTDNPNGAFEFFDWYFSPESAQRVFREAQTLVPFEFTPPPDIQPWQQEIYDQVTENLPTAGETTVDYLPPAVTSEFVGAIQGMAAGDLTPEQVLEQINTAHQTYLKEKGS